MFCIHVEVSLHPDQGVCAAPQSTCNAAHAPDLSREACCAVPDGDDHPQVRARAGSGLHHRAEAIRADAAQRLRAHEAGTRRRLARWCAPSFYSSAQLSVMHERLHARQHTLGCWVCMSNRSSSATWHARRFQSGQACSASALLHPCRCHEHRVRRCQGHWRGHPKQPQSPQDRLHWLHTRRRAFTAVLLLVTAAFDVVLPARQCVSMHIATLGAMCLESFAARVHAEQHCASLSYAACHHATTPVLFSVCLAEQLNHCANSNQQWCL